MNGLDRRREVIASAGLLRAYAAGDACRALVAHLALLEAEKLEELVEVKPERLLLVQGQLAQLRALKNIFVSTDADGST